MAEAALYLAGPDDAAAARLGVAGRPLAFRALMAAIRAGCRRVRVPAALRGGALERAIAASPSARAAVEWLEADGPPPEGPLLLVPATALVPPGELQALHGARTPALLDVAARGEAPVVLLAPEPARTLWPLIARGQPLGGALHRALGDEPVNRVPVADGVRVTSPDAARAAEVRLYASLGSVIDTRLDRVFHRRLSRPISRLAVGLGIGPNAVTLGSLGVGLLSAWSLWQGEPRWALLGVALYAAAVVLDHADGEVARLTFSESRLGEWLDVAVDTAIHALVVLAMGAAAQRLAGGWAATLGVVGAIGVVASSALAKTSPPRGGTGLGGLLDALSNRDGFYAMLALFLAGLALWPPVLPWLMVVVAVGAHGLWLGRLACRLRTGV